MGYTIKRILLVKETPTGTIPANPVLMEYLAESNGLVEEQATEEVTLFGTDGDASPMTFGASSYSGSLGVVLSTDNAPLCLSHALGGYLTAGNATGATWSLNTIHAVGDMVNHSDGKHTLVCYTAGTTGGTAPTLSANPNDDRNVRVGDGTVVWIAMPLLKTATYELSKQMPTFTIEFESEDETGSLYYERYGNVLSSSLPMAMTGGTISVKMAGDLQGGTLIKSTDATWVEPLSAIAGNKIVPTFKDFYSYDDCTVKVDNLDLVEVTDVNIDTNRNVSFEDGINNSKIRNIGTATVKGSINRVFDKTVMTNYDNHADFKLEFDFKKANGCSLNITYPKVKPAKAKQQHDIAKLTYLTSELSAYGTSTVKSVQATATYPALFDTTGTIVGTGNY